MGIDFRSGRYHRRVTVGKRTVKEGEAAVIWSRNGRAREIIGPSIERMFFSTIRFLDRHTALPGQYMVITYKTGTVEHLQGPVSVYENPIRHSDIRVRNSLTLASASDCLIVVSKDGENGKAASVSRNIVHGPMQFFPKVDEIVVHPVWTSTENELSGSYSTPEKARSPMINTSPKPFTILADLTTSDGFTYKVQFGVRLRVVDVQVACSCDPIGEVWQALRTDIIVVGAQFSSASVLQAHTLDKLGESGRLQGMYEAASLSGVEIVAISICKVWRPTELIAAEAKVMEATSKHEADIKSARREAEIAQQKAESQLASADQQAKVLQAEFDAESQRAKLQLDLDATKQQRRLQMEAVDRAEKIESARQENQVLVEFLQHLNSLDVDLTKYLTTVMPNRKVTPSGENSDLTPSPSTQPLQHDTEAPANR